METTTNQRLQIARANLRAGREPGEIIIADGEDAHSDCGPLCPVHGDPRDTSILAAR